MNSIYAEMFLRKSLSFSYKLLILLFVMFIISIIVILNLNYKSTLNVDGIVKQIDSNYYVVLNILDDDVKYVLDNNYFRVNDVNVFYKIYDIDEEIYSNSNANYRIIYLRANIDKKYKVNNLNLKIKLFKYNKKIISYIIDYLKGR